jgi:hypothetical protein
MRNRLILFILLVAVALVSFHLGSTSRINRNWGVTDVPGQDIITTLQKVTLKDTVPQDHWTRHFDIYIGQIPWRNIDSNYLPLYFFPKDSATVPFDPLRYVHLANVDECKPFNATEEMLASHKPFVIYLDYISQDMTAKSASMKDAVIDIDYIYSIDPTKALQNLPK